MKYALAVVLFAFASSAPAQVIWEDGFEKSAPGERAGWEHRNTIAGGSSAAVSSETASPFQGGLQSFRIALAPDDPQGCWITRKLETVHAPFQFSFDFMTTGEKAARVDLQRSPTNGWETVFSLALARSGSASLAQPGRKNKDLAAVSSRVWYRCQVRVTADGLSHITLKDQTTEQKFADLPLLLPVQDGIDRITLRGADVTYFDNIHMKILP